MGTNWSAGTVPCIVFPGLRVVLNHIPCIENIHVVDLFVLCAVTCMKEGKTWYTCTCSCTLCVAFYLYSLPVLSTPSKKFNSLNSKCIPCLHALTQQLCHHDCYISVKMITP